LSDPTIGLVLNGVNVLVATGFYVALRSGWSQRFSDPAMTMPQMGFAILAIALAYATAPQVRGAVPMLLTLVLIFGVFILSPRDCRRLGWFSVACLAVTIGIGSARHPEVFVPQIEVIHFLLSAAVLVVIAALAAELSRLRAQQLRQKLELRDALDRVRQMATHDELTGLPNRRQVMELLGHEERRALRQVAPLCISIIDIDHFKHVNDTLGHQSGDEALRRFAVIIGSGLRAGDVLARWGGEEFILLLPVTPVEEASRVLERLRLRCNDFHSWVERPELQVSFSAGLSAHVAGEPTQLVIARADAALYQAKRSGRDRLEIA
jgi:diguanylate cyclase (GGDEF)-like protein